MAIIKCKMCGGDLQITADMTVAECEYCGSKQTIPTVDNEKKLTLFSRANRLRFACEFDKAAGVYEALVADFPEEAEAYWGLVLCKYGIEYVDDPVTGKKIPTCHRSSFESVMDDSNLEQALENADAAARKLYREEAKQIEELRKGIIEVSGREDPYDIFICYKETDETGDRTLDSVLAQDVYDALTSRGYRVFFSRITLEDKLGQEYEPYIFAALNSAKIMLAFGTDYEYFNAVWVKNEWSRYLQLMTQDKSKHLIPCYKGIDAYDMPKEFAKLQALDMGKLGFIQDLMRGIAKILDGYSIGKSAPKTNSSADLLIKRGYFFLEDGDFRSADEYFERALDEDPENSKAYVGKVLARLHLTNVKEISDYFVKLYDDKIFERAIRFADGADKEQLRSIKETADKKWLLKCLTVGLKNVVKEKETKEVENKIAQLCATVTVEGYQKACEVVKDAYERRINRRLFNNSVVYSYERQADILALLSSTYEDYTIQQIKDSKYFKDSGWADFIFEQDIKRMRDAGSVEKGLLYDSYCIVGAVEKRAQLKNEREYARARELAQVSVQSKDTNGCLAAAKIYENLGDYMDAQSKAAECVDYGNKFKQEYEEELARQEALRRKEFARQEAERKAAEEKRLLEINQHNYRINSQIVEFEQQLEEQRRVYTNNANKIFGAGAKLKKDAKAKIARIESEINVLKRQLK